MENQKQLPQFPFKEISEKIEAKREIYISLIRSTFNFSSVNDEEKTQIANDKFTAEKELYIERLKEYYIDSLEEHKNKGGAMPTLSVFQGVNIFLEVIQSGLSFSEVSNHIYLAVMVGSRGEVAWKMTSDAVVYMAQRVGAISHISDVVIVRNDEDFEVFNEDGEFKVKHSLKFDTNEINYEKDFLCGYVYVIYPSGYRELRLINRQQMDDAYKMSSRKSNYNKISMLKSKVVKRALRFDRKIVIESMINSSSKMIAENKTKGLIDISFDDDGNLAQVSGRANRNVNSDIPEIAKDFDEVEEVMEEAPQQQEVEKKEPENNGLFDGLDLDF
jgi:hypothetical protein